MQASIRILGDAMTPANQVHRVAQHVIELARDCVLPDYIIKLGKAARDLEKWASELESKEQPGAH